MGLERLVAPLGTVIVVLVAGTVAYGCAGVLAGVVPGVQLVPDQAIPWPLAMPAWPLAGFLVALAVVVVQMPLVVVLRARKRTIAAGRRAEADAWLRGLSAQAAKEAGLGLIRLTAFRAHARDSHEVELSWNPQLDEVDEVVVYRSPLAFAASSEPLDGQVIVYSGDDAAYDDIELDDGCVYHYTAFARARDGRSSAPAWAWAATPQLPLHTKLLGTLSMHRILVPGASR